MDTPRGCYSTMHWCRAIMQDRGRAPMVYLVGDEASEPDRCGDVEKSCISLIEKRQG